MRKQTKRLALVLALVLVLGGLAFAYSNTTLFSGNVLDEPDKDDGDLGGFGSGPEIAEYQSSGGAGDTWGSIGVGNDGTDEDDFLYDDDLIGGYVPGGTTGGGGGGTSCDSEYYLDLWLDSIDGNNISSLKSNELVIKTTGGTDVTSSWDYSAEGSGQYQFYYLSGTPSSEYEITIDTNGYQEATSAIFTNDTCSDVRTGTSVELDYNHSITVKDHNGDYYKSATVKTGDSYSTSCSYWNTENKYICKTDDGDSGIYQVSSTGYVTKEGNFANTAYKENTTSVQLAAEETLSDYGLGAASSDSITSFEYSTSLSSSHVTVSLEQAWVIELTDGSSSIKGAEVELDTPGIDYDCDEQESGIYWCDSSYYDTSGGTPNYRVTADGYNTISASFSDTRSSSTDDGVYEIVTLTKATDPASYCESISINTDDLPLSIDSDLNEDITITIESTASNQDYQDTYDLKMSGSGIIEVIYSGSSTSLGTSTTLTHAGTSDSDSFILSGYALGENFTVEAQGSDCSATLEITQETETDTDGDGLDDETEEAVGTDPNNPDSDGDELSDGDEVMTYTTDPNDTDTDDDGYSDYDEVMAGTDPNDKNDVPAETDSDGDGMPDSYEEEHTCLSSTDDSDGGDADYDLDGYSNLTEYSTGYDPCENASDTDIDGLPDDWEDDYTCSDLTGDDSADDYDLDGLTTAEEYENGTSPCDDDSDDDGLSDGYEVSTTGTDPTNDDSDGDGLSDGEEVNDYQTDPNDSDSDNDGDSDGDEVDNGTDPNDSSDYYISSSSDDVDYETLTDDSVEYADCFIDVYDSNELQDTICRMNDAGFVQGPDDSPGYFEPRETLTYAQFAKILSLMMGLPVTNDGTETFLAYKHWATNYIAALEDADVFRERDGFPTNPDLPIPRADMFVYVARAAGLSGDSVCPEESGDDVWQDCTDTDYYAYAANQLYETEIEHPSLGDIRVLQGVEVGSNTYLYPYSYAAREEASAFLLNAYIAYFQ